MLPSLRAALAAGLLTVALLAGACAEPPNKELHLAQGAIEAARAAGAEQYAPEPFTAAVDALERANAAVAQRDYRLALNHALDSREQAQNAAREGANAKAAARGQAERLLAEVTTALAAATPRLEAASAAKLPKDAITAPSGAIAASQRAVQEAGAALGQEDYIRASQVLQGRAATVQAATAEIERAIATAAARPARPVRRRR